MASSNVLAIAAAATACVVLYISLRNALARPKHPFPPGPPPLPILGNLLDIPTQGEHKVYTEWAKTYGDVVHVSVAGTHIVILNSAEAAKDLLDARAAIYSDRPFIPMVHDPSLLDLNWAFTFQRISPEWRRHRRLFVHHLSPAGSRVAILETQKASTHALLRSLLRTSNALATQLKHASAESILFFTYGYKIQSVGDPLLSLVESLGEAVSQGAHPGRFLVNAIPWLKYVPSWFPGSGFKAFAAESREVQRKVLDIPFDFTKRQVDQGIAPPSFVATALTYASPEDLMVDIKSVAGSMYGAGVETTTGAMHYCLLALVLHPEIQARAQTELDSVLGHTASPTFRLPTLSDRARVPYIDALIKEALRWVPIAPLGIPHATTAEDVYRGWRIPKGTVVITNLWAMLQDDTVYPDPRTFRPERFLGEHPAPSPASRGCFGFGRRECPGRHIADAALWIQIASILAVYTLAPGKDQDGRDIDVSYAKESTARLVLYPQDFPCIITPRSKEAEMRVRETATYLDDGVGL